MFFIFNLRLTCGAESPAQATGLSSYCARLSIGEKVEARAGSDRIEVWRRVDYRRVIEWIERKPGAVDIRGRDLGRRTPAAIFSGCIAPSTFDRNLAWSAWTRYTPAGFLHCE